MWMERKACPTAGLALIQLFYLSLLGGKGRVPIRFSVVTPTHFGLSSKYTAWCGSDYISLISVLPTKLPVSIQTKVF